jgi:hypothetical protein
MFEIGDYVRLKDSKIFGQVWMVYPGGDTTIEIDGTIDYLTVDENYLEDADQ